MTGRFNGEAHVAERTLGWKLWEDCWPNLAGLLAANLLFLLWCAPSVVAAMLPLPGAAIALSLVTVGPALLGLFTYTANVALERRASFWRDSLRGFRSGFGPAVMLGGVAIVVLTAHRLSLSQAQAAGMPTGATAFWAGQFGILVILAFTGLHTLSLLALYRQGIKEAFRNAVVLTLAHPAPSLGLMGVIVFTVWMAWALNWGPLIIMPALLALLSVNTTLRLVKRHQQNGMDSSHE